jgi:hypothetical protein
MIAIPAVYDSLTPKERKAVREQYRKLQGNRCIYCFCDLDDFPLERDEEHNIDWSRFPDGFMSHPVHLHHDHDSGLTVGAVHGLCNALLFVRHGK